MITAQQLKDKYESDLKQLQQDCKHGDISDWMSEAWAPGHLTGACVKCCNVCWKTIERRNELSFTFTQSSTIPGFNPDLEVK